MDGPYTIECIGGPNDGEVVVCGQMPPFLQFPSMLPPEAGSILRGKVRYVPSKRNLTVNGHIPFMHEPIVRRAAER